MRKGYCFNVRLEGITCGASQKEFGKAKEVCQIEIVRDEEQRYTHCCVLPMLFPVFPQELHPFCDVSVENIQWSLERHITTLKE